MRVRTLKTGPVDLIFDAPASKSYTHRALIIASLATGDSVLTRPLFAEDTLLTLKSLRLRSTFVVNHRVAVAANPPFSLTSEQEGFPTALWFAICYRLKKHGLTRHH